MSNLSEEEIIKRVENYISEHKWNVQGGYETNTIQALLNLYKNIKDKIKAKIEEINNEKLNYSDDEYYLENEIKGYAIDKIKELLEEE